ncbi:copper resistance protein NlpE [Niabella beijingensis]|uniref:copper resistance protein NlpE n=1 Tax=Niabella beijingensis TaxID=2872700 RepID=UPI001CBDEE91|nr:copper resistance protein NlpE [Niabella beijingensis]MBZ4190667.1 copper resistance protein NlpE [Niabella beijingensis]
MKRWYYFVLLLGMAGCAGEGADNRSQKDTTVYSYSSAPIPDSVKAGTDTIRFEGTYSGILPCASCEGIETSITLFDDRSFAMKEMYKGEQPDSFINKGKYDVRGNILYLKMDGAGIERPVMYTITPNALTQLDMDGKEIKGALAGHYVLIKN